MDLPIKYSKASPATRRQARIEYIARQQGNCLYCGKLLDGPADESKPITRRLYPPNFFNHPIHLHHHHDTDLTQGAVHAYCNAVLWEYHGE